MLTCKNCGVQNIDKARFCKDCGAPLTNEGVETGAVPAAKMPAKKTGRIIGIVAAILVLVSLLGVGAWLLLKDWDPAEEESTLSVREKKKKDKEEEEEGYTKQYTDEDQREVTEHYNKEDQLEKVVKVGEKTIETTTYTYDDAGCSGTKVYTHDNAGVCLSEEHIDRFGNSSYYTDIVLGTWGGEIDLMPYLLEQIGEQEYGEYLEGKVWMAPYNIVLKADKTAVLTIRMEDSAEDLFQVFRNMMIEYMTAEMKNAGLTMEDITAELGYETMEEAVDELMKENDMTAEALIEAMGATDGFEQTGEYSFEDGVLRIDKERVFMEEDYKSFVVTVPFNEEVLELSFTKQS